MERIIQNAQTIGDIEEFFQTARHNGELFRHVLPRVTELLEQGFDVNTVSESGNTLLSLAIRRNMYELVEFLIGNGADTQNFDQCAKTPLENCMDGWNWDRMFPLLIRLGININAPNRQGRTPLMVACYQNAHRFVRLLLDTGADPNILSPDGFLAVNLADDSNVIEMFAPPQPNNEEVDLNVLVPFHAADFADDSNMIAMPA
jgi:ankyrin repeat protein